MNLRFVEAFYWVATLRSISRAAEKLYITQSAMSSRIAALEEELGTLLLDRRDKTFRLTIAGARFLTHAERLLALQKAAREELGGTHSDAPTLRVGAIESVMHSWLTGFLSRLRASRPDLAVELTVETTPLLLDHVRRGVIDIVFAAAPSTGEGVRIETMPSMDMGFMTHARDAKATKTRRRLPAKALDAADIMTFQRGSQPFIALVDLLRGLGFDRTRIHAVSSISAMVELVEADFGLAMLPVAAIEHLSRTRPVAQLAIDVALPPLPIFASYRHLPDGLDMNAVLALARDCARPTRRTQQRKNR